MRRRERDILERHLAGAETTPLTNAIRAALDAIDELTRCPDCKGSKTVFYALHGMDLCKTCKGTGMRR